MRKKIIVQKNKKPSELMDEFGISRATAYRAKRRGYFVLNYHHTDVVIDDDFMQKWHEVIMRAINFAIRKWRSIVREDIFEIGILSYHDMVGEIYLNVYEKSGLRPDGLGNSVEHRDRVFYWVFKVSFFATWSVAKKHIFRQKDRESFCLKDQLNGRTEVAMDHNIVFASPSPPAAPFFNLESLGEEERVVLLAYLHGWDVQEVLQFFPGKDESSIEEMLDSAIRKLRKEEGVDEHRPYPPMPRKANHESALRALRAKAAQKIMEVKNFLADREVKSAKKGGEE